LVLKIGGGAGSMISFSITIVEGVGLLSFSIIT
jgi:hypothetical protein